MGRRRRGRKRGKKSGRQRQKPSTSKQESGSESQAQPYTSQQLEEGSEEDEQRGEQSADDISNPDSDTSQSSQYLPQPPATSEDFTIPQASEQNFETLLPETSRSLQNLPQSYAFTEQSIASPHLSKQTSEKVEQVKQVTEYPTLSQATVQQAGKREEVKQYVAEEVYQTQPGTSQSSQYLCQSTPEQLIISPKQKYGKGKQLKQQVAHGVRQSQHGTSQSSQRVHQYSTPEPPTFSQPPEQKSENGRQVTEHVKEKVCQPQSVLESPQHSTQSSATTESPLLTPKQKYGKSKQLKQSVTQEVPQLQPGTPIHEPLILLQTPKQKYGKGTQLTQARQEVHQPQTVTPQSPPYLTQLYETPQHLTVSQVPEQMPREREQLEQGVYKPQPASQSPEHLSQSYDTLIFSKTPKQKYGKGGQVKQHVAQEVYQRQPETQGLRQPDTSQSPQYLVEQNVWQGVGQPQQGISQSPHYVRQSYATSQPLNISQSPMQTPAKDGHVKHHEKQGIDQTKPTSQSLKLISALQIHEEMQEKSEQVKQPVLHVQGVYQPQPGTSQSPHYPAQSHASPKYHTKIPDPTFKQAGQVMLQSHPGISEPSQHLHQSHATPGHVLQRVQQPGMSQSSLTQSPHYPPQSHASPQYHTKIPDQTFKEAQQVMLQSYPGTSESSQYLHQSHATSGPILQRVQQPGVSQSSITLSPHYPPQLHASPQYHTKIPDQSFKEAENVMLQSYPGTSEPSQHLHQSHATPGHILQRVQHPGMPHSSITQSPHYPPQTHASPQYPTKIPYQTFKEAEKVMLQSYPGTSEPSQRLHQSHATPGHILQRVQHPGMPQSSITQSPHYSPQSHTSPQYHTVIPDQIFKAEKVMRQSYPGTSGPSQHLHQSHATPAHILQRVQQPGMSQSSITQHCASPVHPTISQSPDFEEDGAYSELYLRELQGTRRLEHQLKQLQLSVNPTLPRLSTQQEFHSRQGTQRSEPVMGHSVSDPTSEWWNLKRVEQRHRTNIPEHPLQQLYTDASGINLPPNRPSQVGINPQPLRDISVQHSMISSQSLNQPCGQSLQPPGRWIKEADGTFRPAVPSQTSWLPHPEHWQMETPQDLQPRSAQHLHPLSWLLEQQSSQMQQQQESSPVRDYERGSQIQQQQQSSSMGEPKQSSSVYQQQENNPIHQQQPDQHRQRTMQSCVQPTQHHTQAYSQQQQMDQLLQPHMQQQDKKKSDLLVQYPKQLQGTHSYTDPQIEYNQLHKYEQYCDKQIAITGSQNQPIVDEKPASTAEETKHCKIEVNYVELMLNLTELPDVVHYGVKFQRLSKNVVTDVTTTLSRKSLRSILEKFRSQYFSQSHPAFDGRSNLYNPGILPFDAYFEGMIPISEGEDGIIGYILTLTKVNSINFNVLKDDTNRFAHIPVLQCIDIVLRDALVTSCSPVGKLVFTNQPQIQRSLKIGNGVELQHGLHFSAIRGSKTFVNVDVVHKAYIVPQDVSDAIVAYLNDNNHRFYKEKLSKPLNKECKKKLSAFLRNLKVDYTIYDVKKIFRINDLGDPANKIQIAFKTIINGVETVVNKTIEDYFKTTKRYQLRHPEWPTLWAALEDKNIFLPMELCKISKHQFHAKTLNSNELGTMIKYASTSTTERKNKIQDTWRGAIGSITSKVTEEFKLTLGYEFTKVDAQILDAPKLRYGSTTITPDNGAWMPTDFVQPEVLKGKWGLVCIVNEKNIDSILMTFMDQVSEKKLTQIIRNDLVDLEKNKKSGRSKCVIVVNVHRNDLAPNIF